jgi:short-subunit dehydrogenase
MLKNNEKRIGNVSSISGLISLPLIGAYSATKFALEAISDALRIEKL